MTLFYFSEDRICSVLKDSFDFFDEMNIESISVALAELHVSYSDDQIGFIVPCEHGKFPAIVYEFLEKISLNSDYFFAVIVEGERSSDSPRKFMSLCSKAGINLRYLNFISDTESERKIKDKGISFRSEVGMFVSKMCGLDVKNRLFGVIESLADRFSKKVEK